MLSPSDIPALKKMLFGVCCAVILVTASVIATITTLGTNVAWEKKCVDAGVGFYNTTNKQFQFIQIK